MVVLVTAPAHADASRNTGVGCNREIDITEIIRRRISDHEARKNWFENLLPIEPESIAAHYPLQYQRILELYWKNPSYLMGINGGLTPNPEMRLGEIIQNISSYAWHIGEQLDLIIDTYPSDYYALPILKHYVKRFKQPGSKLAFKNELYDPKNPNQLHEIVCFGKPTVCSIWAEFNLALRLGHVSRVGTYVAELIKDGVVSNSDSSLAAYLDTEIDQLWFPSRDKLPDAVALGETKVFERIFDSGYRMKDKVHKQFGRHLEIVSAIGAQLGLPAELHYFFVAGISEGQSASLFQKTEIYNRNIQNRAARVPVSLKMWK